MKITFASYEHSCLGFPKVLLKWNETNNKASQPYITVHGIIECWTWENGLTPRNPTEVQKECERFDKHVRNRFANDVTVQG